jgi:protein subunit release factor B
MSANPSPRWSLIVSAGDGPEEVRVFVAKLAVVVAEAAQSTGLSVVHTRIEGDPARPRSITFTLTGDAPTALGGWCGTHLLIHSARGPRARRRWFAGVSLNPAPPPAPTELRPEEVTFTASRAGGPGGQHVNKTASAVRAVHTPTGLQVRASASRRQKDNRREALARLDALQREAHQAQTQTTHA